VAKVLFVNPVVRAEDSPRHVPYGMAMLAAVAMRAGHQVQVYDHNAWRVDDAMFKDVMQADDWDVVAAGGITTAYGSLKAIFKAARAYAPKALTVLGGGVLTSMPHDIMRFLPEVDVGVVGEAYGTFPELLAAIDSRTNDYDSIDGLVVRRSGDTYLTRPRALLQDLDSLPYPAWELFPLEEVYFPNSSVALSEEAMTATRRLDINTSYGCSLICRFCFHLGISGDMSYVKDSSGKTDVAFDLPGLHPRTIRYHSPRYIVDMVHYMVDRFKVNFVSFLDENLMTMDQFSKRTWLDAICDLWIAEGLQPECRHKGVAHDENCRHGVHWGGTSHATLCNERILKRMAEAGCSYLDYGWESFSPRILKTVGKGATPDNNLRSYLWTMRAGIRPIPNQMIGFPSEDFQSIRDSMTAWKELGIVAKPFFVTPYPGSEWYAVYKDKILAQYDGNLERFVEDLGDATDITATISENFNPVELYGLRELMVRGEFDKLAKFEREWRGLKGDPQAGIDRAMATMRGKTTVTPIAAE
jgi:radical SAM superfamily enzyme YgiQ (UPF0313 family)